MGVCAQERLGMLTTDKSLWLTQYHAGYHQHSLAKWE